MSFLSKEFELLDPPLKRWFLAIFLGIFASIFLLVFNPYDIQSWELDLPLTQALPIWSAGLIAIPVLLFSQLWLRRRLFKTSFQVKNLLLLMGLELLMLSGIFFLLFGETTNGAASLWGEYMVVVKHTLLLSSIPYIIVLLLLPYIPPYPERPLAHTKGPKNPLLHLQDDKDRTVLSVNRENLLYLKSENNYVSAYYVTNERLNHVLIRTSLKKLSLELPAAFFLRVHRSYMVNLEKIISISAHKNTYLLSLKYLPDNRIPVSTSYKKAVEKQMLNKS